jgi:hypothetical protein
VIVPEDGMALGERRDSGISGGGVDLVEPGAAGERPDERVLATTRSHDEHPHAAIVFEPAFRFWSGVQDWAMDDPGVDRHEWESEWESLEDDLRSDPAHALPEVDRLVARMLDESGYELTDPVVREGEEREVVAEYLAAHEILEAAERDAEELSPGDLAAAVNGYRVVYEHLVTTRAAADAHLSAEQLGAEEA